MGGPTGWAGWAVAHPKFSEIFLLPYFSDPRERGIDAPGRSPSPRPLLASSRLQSPTKRRGSGGRSPCQRTADGRRRSIPAPSPRRLARAVRSSIPALSPRRRRTARTAGPSPTSSRTWALVRSPISWPSCSVGCCRRPSCRLELDQLPLPALSVRIWAFGKFFFCLVLELFDICVVAAV
jgi:hypothetical protein